MATKLYVGGLPYSSTEDGLRSHFAQAGNVVSAAIIMDKMTGRSKGFGFVTCGSQELATEATQASIELKGRMLKIDMARPPSESKNFGGNDRRRGSESGGRSNYGGGRY